MANKDFRSRLKTHKTEYNPEAWAQMSEMLDALPVEKQTRSNNKFWFLLLPILTIALAVIFYFHNGNSSEMNNSLSPSKFLHSESSQESLIDEDLENKITPDISHDNSSKKAALNDYKEIISQESDSEESKSAYIINSTVNSNPIPQKKNTAKAPTNRKSELQQKSVPQANNSIKNIKSRKFTNENTGTSGIVDSNQAVSVNSTKPKNKTNNELNYKIKHKSLNKTKTGIQDFSARLNTTGQSILEELLILETFKAASIMTEQKNFHYVPPIVPINTLTGNRLYWAGSIGGSDINGNRGYYLGTGLFWDANKVIGPEADLSFSSVGDENGISTSFLSSEQELNLTVWAHLNLVRKAHHKLSLEIGPSIGSNWSITKREIQRKNSTPYYNLKAGFSYTYFMSKGDGIGLKSAISLYESAYIAFRYLRKF